MQTLFLPAMFEIEFDHWSWKRTYSAGEGTRISMETPVGKQEVSEKGGVVFSFSSFAQRICRWGFRIRGSASY